MSIYQFNFNNINGEKVSLEAFEGKIVLIVNTASNCGLTYHYKGLEGLYQEYKDCLLYTSPSPRDRTRSRMPSSA